MYAPKIGQQKAEGDENRWGGRRHLFTSSNEDSEECHAVESVGLVFASYSSPADCTGLNRQDRSFTYSGGPKTKPIHRAAWQSTVSSRSESTQSTHVALPPGGAVRSQVDQGERHGSHKIKLQNEPQCNI